MGIKQVAMLLLLLMALTMGALAQSKPTYSAEKVRASINELWAESEQRETAVRGLLEAQSRCHALLSEIIADAGGSIVADDPRLSQHKQCEQVLTVRLQKTPVRYLAPLTIVPKGSREIQLKREALRRLFEAFEYGRSK